MRKNLLLCLNFIACLNIVESNPTVPALTTVLPKLPEIFNQSRRILGGNTAGETRPYMVYLKAAKETGEQKDPNWLCGGTIIHELYILTSAACIEDTKHFYVISGTHKWTDPDDDDCECVKNSAKKAVWKCVPKSYVYDGNQYDNIHWMIADIAVVKVEDPFNFKRRVRGCDFIPDKIAYNNLNPNLEKSKTLASTAGWGSTGVFRDLDRTPLRNNNSFNSPALMEADVMVISKKNCKKRWPERYHYIIDQNMICGKDMSSSTDTICADQHVDCEQLVYSDDDSDDEEDTTDNIRRHRDRDQDTDLRRKAADTQPLRKDMPRIKVAVGGFCENDHGGPLIVGQGKTAVVIGVISACQTSDLTRKCQGPFLYTSVYKYRNLISCAINKEAEATCRRWLRSSKTSLSETTFDWSQIVARSASITTIREPISELRSKVELFENTTFV